MIDPRNKQSKRLKEFFDRLDEALEEHFPKGKCQERGKALMLTGYANILFQDALPLIEQEIVQKIVEMAEKIEKWPDLQLQRTLKEKHEQQLSDFIAEIKSEFKI